MNSKIHFFIFSSILFFACSTAPKAQTQAPATPKMSEEMPPKKSAFLEWETKMIDLGPVKKGETRDMEFVFTNVSGEPIEIDIADACECTTFDYPRGVIQPGEKGKVPATFNSESKDAGETIPITLYFKNRDAQGIPRIERVEYKFELVK